MSKKVNEEMIEEIQSCVRDKKNPNKCIENVLEAHGFDPEEDKATVLTKVLKETA